MTPEPLRSFAERIVRNEEYQQIVDAILEQEGSLEKLSGAIAKHRYVIQEPPGRPRPGTYMGDF